MKTAFLTLDVQAGILATVPKHDECLRKIKVALQHARERGFPIFHIAIGFAPGYPGITDESNVASIKKNGLYEIGSASAALTSGLVNRGDRVLHKTHYGAFSSPDLDQILKAEGIKHLVLSGFVTSGVVLSTLRQAFDLDYKCAVLSDACGDRDDEVQRVLIEKIFPKQARVLSVEEFTQS